MNRTLGSALGFAVLSLAVGFSVAAQLELRNPDGRLIKPFSGQSVKATVFVFIRTDCPISNRYAPEIQRLYEKYRTREVDFWLIYPGRKVSPATIQAHLREYAYSVPALRDPDQKLVRLTGVEVTPEVAVYAGAGDQAKLVYRGRIDDRVEDFGKARPSASKHDLEETLDSILNGRPVKTSATKAIGCFIADLE